MGSPLKSRTRTASRIDRIGVCLAVVALCCAYFAWLWRRALPALIAGAALAYLLLRTLHLLERRTLLRREKQLRRRLGGEMAVDSLLLQSQENAVANAAAWLKEPMALSDFTPATGGLIAMRGGIRLFIACLQKHRGGRASPDDVLSCLRRAREADAEMVVLCATCAFSPEAAALAGETDPRAQLIGRETLCELAGLVAPATDEQLRALGQRSRGRLRRLRLLSRALDPTKAGRYALYGLTLLGMYALSRRLLCLVFAAICLLLFALCRRKPKKKLSL